MKNQIIELFCVVVVGGGFCLAWFCWCMVLYTWGVYYQRMFSGWENYLFFGRKLYGKPTQAS
jgi:hypothetical protein